MSEASGRNGLDALSACVPLASMSAPVARESADVLSVLIVDDDYEDNLITTHVLELCDLNVVAQWRATCAEGLEVLRSGGCDVCLLDYQLGGETGMDLLQAVTESECRVPVIMLTGARAEDLDTSALSRGAADYLDKGDMSAHTLGRAIRYAIERRRARDERDYLERQLRQAQKMEAVGRLSGGIAHDINNLLNVIIANVDLMRSVESASDDDNESLSEIRNAAQRGGNLVRKLLAYSRREYLALRHTDLRPTLRDIAELLPRLLPASITVKVTMADEPLSIFGDADAIHQIILNLATNARDAMPAGGDLELSVRRMELDGHFCAGHPGLRPGEHAVIAVRDTGCGMDAVTVSKAFEPFFSTKPEDAGTGLGLAMVYGLTKQLRGHVSIDSAVGRGTKVTVYVPIEEGTAGPQPPPEVRDLPLEGNETILLVEDQLQLRRAARKILERAGYEVQVACDGQEALRVYDEASKRVDLIVTDLVMPNMGGQELYAALSKGPSPPKFLFTSGYSADYMGTRDGEEDLPLLRKPWTLDDLLRAVRGVLGTNHDIDGLHTVQGESSPRFRRMT